MTSDSDLIVVGKLGRPRGLSGDIWVTPLTDYPDRFLGMTEIHIRDRDEWQRTRIVRTEMIGGRPVLRIEGIGSPEEAARFTGRELGVAREQLVDLPTGTYFLFDLVGCEAIDDTTGETIGKVVDVRQYPANDVYVVKTESDKEILVPAVRQYVKGVDIDSKRIRMTTAGLLDSDDR